MAQLHDATCHPSAEDPGMRPFVVIEGDLRSATTRVAGAVAVARADGWTIVRGWAAPLGGDRVLCTGWIRNADDARRALLAAVAGASLVVAASADAETMDRLLEDLRHLGPVDRIVIAAR